MVQEGTVDYGIQVSNLSFRMWDYLIDNMYQVLTRCSIR